VPGTGEPAAGLFDWLFSPFTVMPIQIFNWTSRPDPAFHQNAAAASFVLVLMTLGMNAWRSGCATACARTSSGERDATAKQPATDPNHTGFDPAAIHHHAAAEPALKAESKDLDFYYGDFKALKGISMPVYENKVTALIGPSGCGKSTFLRCFNRMHDLYPGHRYDGEIDLLPDNVNCWRRGR
jgi:ABC-type transport system involved in cytochrome bd biosynthesis fused ATPase/permease subunit